MIITFTFALIFHVFRIIGMVIIDAIVWISINRKLLDLLLSNYKKITRIIIILYEFNLCVSILESKKRLNDNM